MVSFMCKLCVCLLQKSVVRLLTFCQWVAGSITACRLLAFWQVIFGARGQGWG